MAEYRKGYKVDPKTGLTEPEARAGLTRAEAEAQADDNRPAPRPSPAAAVSKRRGRTWGIVGASVGALFLLLIILGIAFGGSNGQSDSSSPANPTTQGEVSPPPPPPPPPPNASGPKKASNGDDAAELHNRAQQAVNRTQLCIASVLAAVQASKSDVAGASNLQGARSVCEAAKTYLATENMHGFSDQATELFGAADEAKSATGAGLAYIDTLAPSKLADFQRHVQDASGYYKQGLNDLNARLSELGVAHVK